MHCSALLQQREPLVYTGEVPLLLISFCMLCSRCSHEQTQYHYLEKKEIEEAFPHIIQIYSFVTVQLQVLLKLSDAETRDKIA
jgi:hypothetical protein